MAVAAAVCRAEFGDGLTYVCVGDECWNADDEETPLPHVFSCGATLYSTVGGYRLDLSNAIVIVAFADMDDGYGLVAGTVSVSAGTALTFAATKGKAKEEATITLNGVALPDWAVGTFDGEAVKKEIMDDGGASWTVAGLVSLTVSATGKISGKMFREGETWTLSAESFVGYDESLTLPPDDPVFGF